MSAIDVVGLVGNSVQSKSGDFNAESLRGKVVAFYFSAHWCPPCRAFTPVLIESYRKAKAELGDAFELIFVSSDQNQAKFDEYWGTMDKALAIKFSAEDVRAGLSDNFDVSGIPTLVVIGKDGKLITTDGRSDVAQNHEAAFKKWVA